MKNKYKLLIICILSFIIGITIYINPLFIYRNYKLTSNLEDICTKERITNESLVPFNYDKLYIIYPYTPKEDIEKEIGIKSRYIKENNNDSYQTIIVTKDNKVISSTKISLKYSFQPLVDYNYISKRDTVFKIYNSNDTCSIIEQYKYYEDTFYDISYTLPESYQKEDNEDIRMYYLDIDTNDHITIEKDDNFKLNKYLETKEVLLEKDMYINNYKVKYLEYENILYSAQRLEVAYIIDINDSTYIFNLDSGINPSKEKLAIYKESLYNIVQSIKEGLYGKNYTNR